jgi:hypothetical protein
MSDTVRGMIVYHRVSHSRGTVTAGNQFTGMIAVQWDDGARQLINVQELMSEKLYNEIKEAERLEKMSIKDNQCTIGATVYLTGKTAPLTKGKIAGPISQHPNQNVGKVVIVEYESGELVKVALKALLSEGDGVLLEQTLTSEAERLEREFAQVETEVAAKLNQAAELVREAGKLADAKGVDILEMYDATRGLERAMESAGWNTSSWHC